AWKSLQTLPGFSDLTFTYTADARSISDTAARTFDNWMREVRKIDSAFPPATVLDSGGRFQEDVFRRLRSERDEKPIVLAE
ncbi:MAG: hypothetical protein JWO45_1054, partial [Spartobacteria bacterium]|nr:hypothetical protein [Spartobacteria bacterium]